MNGNNGRTLTIFSSILNGSSIGLLIAFSHIPLWAAALLLIVFVVTVSVFLRRGFEFGWNEYHETINKTKPGGIGDWDEYDASKFPAQPAIKDENK